MISTDLSILLHALTPLSASPAATRLKGAYVRSGERAGTTEPQDCSGSLTLSNGETIRYHVMQVYADEWTAWDDNNTDGRGGWGETRDDAIAALREILE